MHRQKEHVTLTTSIYQKVGNCC